MITIHDLAKRFGALDVLCGLDLEIQPGRVTGVVGPNGAGKTTLIKIILGLTRPDGGRVLMDGEPIGNDAAYRMRVGYMPQIARFPENLTGAELIAMVEELRGQQGEATARGRDRELIERFHLAPHLHKPLRTLSGGTRQKVNAVLAFLFDPDLLILDEPTSGLDPVASGILKAKVGGARAAGKTVIVTSHVMSELEEIADDIAFVLEGRVRFAGSVHDLKLHTRQLSLERAIAQMMTRTAA
ncbi:MAG TPA: ABC transporter ATP-binding protein [Gemmatimonadaceae bacterium]|jgi:Cu-processing system ATP-binding protein|nr:ABC transporter ATP-binding protein [Gemmatimonadaceae bacterium]